MSRMRYTVMIHGNVWDVDDMKKINMDGDFDLIISRSKMNGKTEIKRVTMHQSQLYTVLE